VTVLALRALGIGDLAVAVPALRGLRAAFPDRRLTLAAPDWLAPLVELTGAVDQLTPLSNLEGVVTAAGIDRPGPLSDVDSTEWDRVVQVNLLGTAAVIRGALPYLRQAHGRVVTVASTLGLRAVPDATAYCAAKFGVVGFTRALAAELAGEVGVTLLVPGGMRTRFFDGRAEQYRPGDETLLGDPANVAAAVLFVLQQPAGCALRELVVTPELEPSYP